MEEVPPELDSAGNSHKKLIIISILTLIIVIAFLSVLLIKNYTSKKEIKISEESLSIIIYPIKDQQAFPNQSAQNPEDAKRIIENNKAYILNQVNDLKSKGETTYIILEGTITCGNGRTISQEDSYFSGDQCGSSGEESITGLGNYKEINVNSSPIMFLLYISSMGSVIQERAYANLREVSEGTYSPSSSIIDNLAYASEMVSLHKKLRQTMDEGYNFPTELDEWEHRFPEGINFKEELNSFDLEADVSEEEINSVDLISGCESLVNQIKNAKVSAADSLAKRGACSEFEKQHKENAIKILRSLEIETNPFIKFLGVFYVTMFVNCGDQWLTNEGQKCIDENLVF
ncbi:MAG: hypothetical protein KKB79_01465 [Nanoarchaeota archaeon]|nr:hypothetical protein [Nanoarchaeota archaeon]